MDDIIVYLDKHVYKLEISCLVGSSVKIQTTGIRNEKVLLHYANVLLNSIVDLLDLMIKVFRYLNKRT